MRSKRMALTEDGERETVITLSDADQGVATIYTCQPPMARLLRRHPHARLLEEHREQGGRVTGVEFELPFACLAILARPRASTWARLQRSGPRRRAPRRRSLVSIRRAQVDHPGAGPGGGP